MYSENDIRLYHHGILGQKWGQRNGPPYPLKPSQHSASEKKAGWRKSLSAGSSGASKKETKYPDAKAAKKAAKLERKARDRKIQEEYDKELEKIESKYKRGQILSDEDIKKEKDLEERTQRAWRESERIYKNTLIDIKQGAHPDHYKINKKKAADMSDQELKLALERRRMENEYNKDSSSKSTLNKVYKGAKRAAEVAATVTSLAVAANKVSKMATGNAEGGLPNSNKTNNKKFTPTSPIAYIAKKQNERVDRNFQKWKENEVKKKNAIDTGKKMNAAREKYEQDPSKENKAAYNDLKSQYKKELRDNTTYRKGDIKKAVQSDMSRKHLSAAKKTKKLLDADPTNKELKKQYNKQMSQYSKERASARRAPEVAKNRSQAKANAKRRVTRATNMAIKAVTVAAAVKLASDITKTEIRANETFRRAYDLGREAMRYIY